MSSRSQATPKSARRRKNLWFERLMAIAASANVLLVVFDLTYVNWRNFWLQGNVVIPFTDQKIHIPLPMVDCPDRSVQSEEPPRTLPQSAITCVYDPIKGIQPHRDTQLYLSTVATLQQQAQQKGLETGLKSPEVQATLQSLRQFSNDMITTNPFEGAGKSGTLEKIKNRMRGHIASRHRKPKLSSREAFDLFWSTQYLTPANWNREMEWFNQEVKPLIETNFYRTIDENGQFTNHFWILDAPFVMLFFLEFLARTYYISRRYPSLRWLDAMFWRWYDVPLFVPFSLFFPVLALTRILPAAIRLHQSELIDLHEIRDHMRRGLVADIAEELTEVIVIQVLNQVQAAIRRGEFTAWLEQTERRRYIDINETNEVEAIANHIIQLSVNQVFPKIQPDLEALLRYSITSILNQSPVYRSLQSLPGVGHLPYQLTEQIVSDATQFVHNSIKTAVEDPTLTELSTRLVQNIARTFVAEARQQNTLPELQLLLSDLIEEIKINYVQRLTEEDIDLILEQTRQLHQLPQKRGETG